MEKPALMQTVELVWYGPFAWPGVPQYSHLQNFATSAVAKRCGVYLWTVEHGTGFLIYAAGITRRPFRERFREHSRAYRTGVYTVYDAASLMRGERKKVWPGFWFRSRAVELEQQYQAREPEITSAAMRLLSSYRVFLAPVEPTPRVLERIEAAIMSALYAAGGVVAEIPDRGMALSPRWDNEVPFLVRSTTAELIHGLPAEFDA